MESLPADEVHVWYLSTGQDQAVIDRYYQLLCSQEKQRYHRFKFEKGRREFLLGRGLLRTVLSRYWPVLPEAWRFQVGEQGKPAVDRPESFRHPVFNVAHTEGLVACAVAAQGLVGVDVERLDRKTATADIANRFFAPAEVRALNAEPADEYRHWFFRYWTLKEAYVKARGLGLSLPLNLFAFDLSQLDEIRVTFEPGLSDDPQQWQFWLWQALPSHQGAVAVHRRARQPLTLVLRHERHPGG
jgi:4'-phosphopantetheinyl transferase